MIVKGYDIRPGADLCWATLSEANLRGAALRGANLRGAALRRADLHGADLSEANLRGAALRGANLRKANLCGAVLIEAGLRGASLQGADLRRANLRGANLRWANLRGASLQGADLRGADLRGADLYRADLRGADLVETNFYRAILTGTVLDPDNEPNGGGEWPESEGGYVYGYRTQKCPHIGEYKDGQVYGADVFSTSDDECHPGLYLWPTLEAAGKWAPRADLIRVRTQRRDVHQAGTKYRCRWFRVMGTAFTCPAPIYSV